MSEAKARAEDKEILASALLEALPYLNYLAGKTVVVKFGGSALAEGDTVLGDIVLLRRLGVNPILVHGGGSEISRWLAKVGKKSEFVNGLRVTDEESIEVVRMVLVGKINQELVGAINSTGGRAIGLSGLDGWLMRGEQDMEHGPVGLVGKVTAVDLQPLQTLIDAGYIPVIAPLALDEQGRCLNLNADTAAGQIAAAMGAEKLIFLTDVVGISDSNGQLLTQVDEQTARELIAAGVIKGGMIPKVEACLACLSSVKRTHIIDGRVRHALIRELFTDRGVGTMITKKRESAETGKETIQALVAGLLEE